MLNNAGQLKNILQRCAQTEIWLPILIHAMEAASINTLNRQAMFLAQIGHESADCIALVENLNYSAERLQAVWPARFPSAQQAARYHRRPEQIANCVYANRMGNGNEKSGDGWKYRGRGLIQLTGRNAYAKAGAALGLDLLGQPDLVSTPEIAARTAAWYWQAMGLNRFADAGDLIGCTRVINGGSNGLDDRRRLWVRARQFLGT